jgi:hypothetical protein
MTQPAKLPEWATDALYPAGPYVGEPTKIEPSGGIKASGVFPLTRFAAQRFNWLIGNLGDHAAALAPIAVDNWGEQRTQTGTFKSYGSRGRAFSIGIGPTRLGYSSSSVGFAFYYSDEAHVGWTLEPTGPGFTDMSQVAYGDGVVLVVRISDGTVRRTADLGTTWSSGGTLSGSGARLVHYFAAAGMWLVPGATGGDNYVAYDADLTGTWVIQPVPAGALADTNIPIDIVSNDTECLVIYSNGHVIRTTNGTSWTDATLPGWSGSAVGIAYNESQALWAAVSTTGGIWLSSTGAAWSAAAAGETGNTGTRVAALGRYWVYPTAASYLYRFDADEGVIIRETLFSSELGISDIHRHGDQLVIAFVNSTNDLAYRFSMRLTGG